MEPLNKSKSGLSRSLALIPSSAKMAVSDFLSIQLSSLERTTTMLSADARKVNPLSPPCDHQRRLRAEQVWG
jgi:hypothetical protein